MISYFGYIQRVRLNKRLLDGYFHHKIPNDAQGLHNNNYLLRYQILPLKTLER